MARSRARRSEGEVDSPENWPGLGRLPTSPVGSRCGSSSLARLLLGPGQAEDAFQLHVELDFDRSQRVYLL